MLGTGYLDTAGVSVLGAFLAFFVCFLVFVVVVFVSVWLVAAGGFAAGACPAACLANVSGMVAAASAITSKLFFISFFSLAGPSARSQFHLEADADFPR